jgi:hypothetical protein
VKARIELGPKDAEQNLCIVARSQPLAGKVAYKVTGEISGKLIEQVEEMLSMPDSEVPEANYSKPNTANPRVEEAGTTQRQHKSRR